jgi:hypothetical protein
MNNLIETRKKVYESFPKENLSADSSGIVLFYDINNNDYEALTKATQDFLCKSLSLVHGREFVWTDTFLEDNDDLIQNLPNKTPNGVVNPKKETINEFIEIQRLVRFLLQHKRMQDNIVILFDEANGDPEVENFLRSHSQTGEFTWHKGKFERHFADWKNKLTSLCNGDYIFQIDADEYPHPELIVNLPAILDVNYDTDVFTGSIEVVAQIT